MRKLTVLIGLALTVAGCLLFTTSQHAQMQPDSPQSQSVTAQGTANGSISLSGAGAYMEVPNHESLNISGPVTVEAWIKTGSASSPQGIVERYKWLSTQDGGFALRLTSGGKLQFYTIRSSVENDSVLGSTTVTPNVWHHVAGVFDGGELRVYLDGVLDGAKASTLAPAPGTANLRIGSAGHTNANFFSGLIDEARVTGGVLYARNFIPSRSLTVGGLVLGGSGPKGIWNFNERTANDSSGHANHGTLAGGAGFTEDVTNYHPQSASGSATASSVPKRIDFDEVLSGTNVSNYYRPYALFSTGRGGSVSTRAVGTRYSVTSLPNAVPSSDFYANFIVDFPSPVNNLRFDICSGDDYGTIAFISYVQDGVIRGPIPVPGLGGAPIEAHFGRLGIDRVTRVIVHNITDSAGLNYDTFLFDVLPLSTPTPTVTPTPTPTPPPPPPTNLVAEVLEEEQVKLTWFASPGATSYNLRMWTDPINRSDLSVSHFITGTTYTSTNRTNGKTYFFSVSAVNSAGESPESNRVAAAIPSACGSYVAPRPQKVRIAGPQYFGWEMEAEITDRDGLVIRDVKLNGRYLTKMMSAPYYTIKTNRMSAPGRGELTPASITPNMKTRLVAYYPPHYLQEGVFAIGARYAVDHISENSQSCLFVEQWYQFADKLRSGQCEPSETLACQRFFPFITYEFKGRGAEVVHSVNIPQRFHHKVNGQNGNSIGLFRDCDLPIVRYLPGPAPPGLTPLPVGCGLGKVVIDREDNPVEKEQKYRIVESGNNRFEWDNFHQSWDWRVKKPFPDDHPTMHDGRFVIGGCAECVHDHWRWGKYVPNARKWGGGSLLNIHGSSQQDVDIAIVRFRDTPEEIHPTNYLTLVNGESVRRDTPLPSNDGSPVPYSLTVTGYPDEVVFWYSSTGHFREDKFHFYPAFANPDSPNQTRAVGRGSSGSVAPSSAASQDGPTSVTFAHLYEDGPVTFTEIDPAAVAPLPPGYTALHSVAYDINTAAVASGPHIVTFNLPSVADQATFDGLRVFHAEQDSFDPEAAVLVDRTILGPAPTGPDFASKTIKARVDELGPFVIGVRTGPIPVPSPVDLSVQLADAPDSVRGDEELTHTVTVSNGGGYNATNVGLMTKLSTDASFERVSASQGACKAHDGKVYCKLGTINAGAAATVTVVSIPSEGEVRFPAEGKLIETAAVVRAAEPDINPVNNSDTEGTTALPSLNLRPTVEITAPSSNSMYVGPANLTVTAQARDSDGSVSKVEFYDNGNLIGAASPNGSGQFVLPWSNVGFGTHALIAVVTDNGGKSNTDGVGVTVNGLASVALVNPVEGSVIPPSSDVTLAATASHPSSPIGRVDFYADDVLVGSSEGLSGYHNVTWHGVRRGQYSLTAVATDASGVTTTSPAVNVTVTTPPEAAITYPADGSSFPSTASITIAAESKSGFARTMDFYADGVKIGAGLRNGSGGFTFTWRNAADGIYSLTAVATDDFGLTATSSPIIVGVNRTGLTPGEFVWFDDELPQGATAHNTNDDWYWVASNPGPLFGKLFHQSRNVPGMHQHYFDGATSTMRVNHGDRLYAYVFLDPNNKPQEIMLQWHDGSGWEHRAYWGENAIELGADGTPSRRYMGELPKSARWVRLEVPAAAVGLEGKVVSGMAFTLHGGTATWDRTGKLTQSAPPLAATQPGDTVWFDNAVPAGAASDELINDRWDWTTPPVPLSGAAHQMYPHDTGVKYRLHGFYGAHAAMTVNPGDVLFTWVYLDPDRKPDQIILQWRDSNSSEHRAFWATKGNFIGRDNLNWEGPGSDALRYMGSLPPAGRWVKLEVPASYVGLEGKTVTGMAFGAYREGNNPRAYWDLAGKSPRLSPKERIPERWSNLTRLWRYKGTRPKNYYHLSLLDFPQQTDQSPETAFMCYIFPSRVAGAEPLYRFRWYEGQQYFYTMNPGHVAGSTGWRLDANGGRGGIVGYVYRSQVAGTVPLYGYQSPDGYYYTVNRFDRGQLPDEYVVGYVYPKHPLVPNTPSLLSVSRVSTLQWRDNSADELGFKIERLDGGGTWSQIATVGPNITTFNPSAPSGSAPETAAASGGASPYYRVRAFNEVGDSDSSNASRSCGTSNCPKSAGEPEDETAYENSVPGVSIVTPENTDIVGHDVIIRAAASDDDGPGTLGKAEFFVGGNKIGEVAEAPYIQGWYNAPPGTYTLTVKVTDSAGVTAVSAPVTITITGNAPTGLVATADSATQVSLNWSAPDGGAVSHYVVERSQSVGGPYNALSPQPTGTSFIDGTTVPNTAYLYRVRAIFASGGDSGYSNLDLATTVMFMDDPLQPGTTIRARHLVELRSAVGAVRLLSGLSSASWTYPDPVSEPASQRRYIYLEDVQELRTQLDAALSALGRYQAYPADPPLARGATVRKEHFQQIRDRVK